MFFTPQRESQAVLGAREVVLARVAADEFMPFHVACLQRSTLSFVGKNSLLLFSSLKSLQKQVTIQNYSLTLYSVIIVGNFLLSL